MAAITSLPVRSYYSDEAVAPADGGAGLLEEMKGHIAELSFAISLGTEPFF